MRRIAASKNFQKRLRTFLKKYLESETQLAKVFSLLGKDIFIESLHTHKLSGVMKYLHACSISYSYRLVFNFDDEFVYLLDIGTHDEVY